MDASGNPVKADSGGALSAFAPTWKGIQDNVFTPICTLCHVGASAPLGLRLEESVSYDLLLTERRRSTEQPDLLVVEPGDPDRSYMIRKLEGWTSITGGQMPLQLSPLQQDTINVIRAWIAVGAPRSKTSVSDEPRAASDSLPPCLGGVTLARSNGSTGAWVSWMPAADDQTPPEGLRYLVSVAPLPRSLDDATPLLQTAPGATSCYLFGLAPATSYRIGVEPRDAAGNLGDVVGETFLATGLADAFPPRFAGLTSARAQDASYIHCWWSPAADDHDPSEALVYKVTWVEGEGMDFPGARARALVTQPGATHAVLSGLRPATRYRIGVFAGDTSGNWSPSHGCVDVATPQ